MNNSNNTKSRNSRKSVFSRAIGAVKKATKKVANGARRAHGMARRVGKIVIAAVDRAKRAVVTTAKAVVRVVVSVVDAAVVSPVRAAVTAVVHAVDDSPRVKRAYSVARTIGRMSAALVGAIGALTVAFTTPMVAVGMVAAGSAYWGVTRHLPLPGMVHDAIAAVERVVVSAAKAVFAVTSAAMLVAIVATAAMSPLGIVDLALLSWLLWGFEAREDAANIAPRSDAARGIHQARTAIAVRDLFQASQRATA